MLKKICWFLSVGRLTEPSKNNKTSNFELKGDHLRLSRIIIIIMATMQTLVILLGLVVTLVHAFHTRLPPWPEINAIQRRCLRCVVKDDVNAIPESKRRLCDVTLKLEENMSPNIINYHMLLGSLKDLELTTSQPKFWDEPEKAQSTLAEQNKAKAMVKRIENWKSTVEDISSLIEFASQEDAQSSSKSVHSCHKFRALCL